MNQKEAPRRASVWILAGFTLLLVLAFVRVATLGDRTLLELEHTFRATLASHGKVADLNVPGIPGLKMFLHPDDHVITYRIMADGIWEANETHWVSKFVGPGDTFVDIGANVGYFTLVASRLVGENGKVFAFEPDPVAFSILQRNVELNGLTNVALEQKAVSNAPGTIQLYLSEENKGDHQIYKGEEDRVAIDVEAVTLNDYFRDYDGHIDFVKIDTQGAEGVILEGMGEVIDANEDIAMAVEFWPLGLSLMGSDPVAYLERLRSHDFLFYDLGLGAGGILELHEVHEKGLLKRFTGANERSFTNLLVIKGYEKAQTLGWDLLSARHAVTVNTPELLAAQEVWEREMVARIREHGASAAELPEGLPFVLGKERGRRTAADEKALFNYFRSVTPILASEREQARKAQASLEEHQSHVLANRMRAPSSPGS